MSPLLDQVTSLETNVEGIFFQDVFLYGTRNAD